MALKQAIQDRLLTGVSNMLTLQNLIAEAVVPTIPVKERTGKLSAYGLGQIKSVTTRIGGDGEFRRVEPITRTQTLYSLEKHGIYNLVSQDDYDNVQEPYEAEVDETLGLTSVIKTEKEETFASLFSAANVSQGKTLGTAEKFDKDTSDVREEITTGRKTVREGCGISPNTAIIPENVIDVLLGNDQLKEWYRSGAAPTLGGGLISYTEIAKFLQVSRLHVPNSSKTTDGIDISQIWDNDIQLIVAPPTAIKRQVCFGYRLLRRGSAQGGGTGGGGLVVYKNRPINPPVGTNIFVEDDYAYLIANAKAAYVLRETITIN